ncbi:precorrin-3B synthase [Streptomyces sp. NBC_00989]|uniref:precorrin-3B synthase n=1 Tax=Streptomyces sp. NBC_00989 TaxID=2903705 RepID=UPI00386D34C7|nr:precorrin-3B synthase [Streptomyces sp. NBC_00989]
MLAAMSTAALHPSSQATAVSRDRGDACPGSLRLHFADDGALARIRVPGGVLTVRQAEALSDAAERLGDGELHLTSRGNVQLRGLGEGCGTELAGLLDAAGLLPSHGHERIRNIVASPLSGLDGGGLRDVQDWLAGLDAELCASEAAQALSGRFLFAVDDGRGDVAGLGADVTLRATADDGAQLGLGAADETLRISAKDAPRAALIAAAVFLEAARASGTRAWRVTELPVADDELIRLVGRRLDTEGIAHERRPREAARTDGPRPGVVGEALSVHVPLGRLSALPWRELASVATGEVRLTPWRGVVLPTPGMTTAQAGESLTRLAATGLVTDPDSPWLRVGACVGRPGCAKSHADVRTDAANTRVAASGQSLPLYWSGCERRCGHPRGDRIDVVAAPGGGYRLATAVAGQESRTADMNTPFRLATALAAITS